MDAKVFEELNKQIDSLKIKVKDLEYRAGNCNEQFQNAHNDGFSSCQIRTTAPCYLCGIKRCNIHRMVIQVCKACGVKYGPNCPAPQEV